MSILSYLQDTKGCILYLLSKILFESIFPTPGKNPGDISLLDIEVMRPLYLYLITNILQEPDHYLEVGERGLPLRHQRQHRRLRAPQVLLHILRRFVLLFGLAILGIAVVLVFLDDLKTEISSDLVA